MKVPWRLFASALLGLLVVVSLAACGSDESPSATVVPGDHAAVQLHAMTSVDEATTVAQDAAMDFVCGTFPVPGLSDGTDTSACMVSDQGVVAVIAFDSAADVTYVVSGPAIDGEVTVPVDETDVYGVEAAPGRLTLSIETSDTVVGTVTFGA